MTVRALLINKPFDVLGGCANDYILLDQFRLKAERARAFFN